MEAVSIDPRCVDTDSFTLRLPDGSIRALTRREQVALQGKEIGDNVALFPGLGVSKHPMVIVTERSTYEVGWALRDGSRPISRDGEPLPFSIGSIDLLKLGESMLISTKEAIPWISTPVVFIDRRSGMDGGECAA